MKRFVIGAAYTMALGGVLGMIGLVLHELGEAFGRDPWLWLLPAITGAGFLILYQQGEWP